MPTLSRASGRESRPATRAAGRSARGDHHERGRQLVAVLLLVARLHAGAGLQHLLLAGDGLRDRELGSVVESHHLAARVDALDLALDVSAPRDRYEHHENRERGQYQERACLLHHRTCLLESRRGCGAGTLRPLAARRTCPTRTSNGRARDRGKALTWKSWANLTMPSGGFELPAWPVSAGEHVGNSYLLSAGGFRFETRRSGFSSHGAARTSLSWLFSDPPCNLPGQVQGRG